MPASNETADLIKQTFPTPSSLLPNPSRVVRVSRAAMGSQFEIVLAGENVDELTALGYDALDRVDWLEQQLSHFSPDSDISRINALAHQEFVPVSPSSFALLLRCQQWHELTEGAFDCTAGKLVRLWGFWKQGIVQGDAIDLPDAEEIARIVANIGWKWVELDAANFSVRFHSSDVELHLGAVGKGCIVQAAADYLRSQGVRNALLHCGHSSIVAIGAAPDGEAWRVGVNDGVLTVPLCERSLSLSDNREIWVVANGERCGHLLDPRTGFPIECPQSFAVIAPDAAEADAFSTAFAVNGSKWTQNFLRQRPDLSVIML
jgi:FAD:protein FMN transferase